MGATLHPLRVLNFLDLLAVWRQLHLLRRRGDTAWLRRNNLLLLLLLLRLLLLLLLRGLKLRGIILRIHLLLTWLLLRCWYGTLRWPSPESIRRVIVLHLL